MSRFSYWYSGLSRKGRIGITAGGIAVAVIVAVIILYLVFKPTMVEVRYGEIVWDPIDGHVWEDNTETKMVEASEAGDYKVTYIEQLSPEHEEQIKQAEELAQQEKDAAEQSSGYESLEATMPEGTLEQLNDLQQSISVMSQDVISGMEMANELSETRSMLQTHYDQVMAFPVIPEAEQYKQQYLSAIAKYIQACDMALMGIETTDSSYFTQAQTLFNEATAIIQQLGSLIQDLIPPMQ